MAAIRLRYVILCVMVFAMSSLLETSAEGESAVEGGAAVKALSTVEAPAPVEAPADDEGNSGQERKRFAGQANDCKVAGYVYHDGEVFSYPGYSHCIKYRCKNGGYSIVESACEKNSQCVPLGSVTWEGCRSWRCEMERQGSMNYYSLTPTAQAKCEDESGRCVNVGSKFTKVVDGQVYRNCLCMYGGGYDCRG